MFKRILRWWGQEYPRVEKLDDLMPINVTVTNSGILDKIGELQSAMFLVRAPFLGLLKSTLS